MSSTVPTRAADERHPDLPRIILAGPKGQYIMSSQHAVIIGGSSGIGLATARKLLAAGLKVTVTGRSAQRIDEACQLLGGAKGLVMDAAATDWRRSFF